MKARVRAFTNSSWPRTLPRVSRLAVSKAPARAAGLPVLPEVSELTPSLSSRLWSSSMSAWASLVMRSMLS